MKKTIQAVAFAAMAVLLSSPAFAQQTLRLGTEGAYPPFNFKQPDGKLGGFDIELGNAICAEMKVTCEWSVQDFDGSIPALEAGKFDAIFNITITEERAQRVDFTHKYYQTPPALVAPKDTALTGGSPADLKGKIIGVQNGTVHANFATDDYPDSQVKSYPSGDEARADLVAGRVDVVMDGSVILTEWLKSDAGTCCKLLATLTPDPAVHGPGVGIALPKGSKELADKLNAAIDALRANGTYKTINDKYFPFDVYGG